MKVGINGFGRIGRTILRTALKYGTDLEFVAVNDLTDSKTLAYLLRHDSVHGNLDDKIEVKDDAIVVNGREIKVFANPDPGAIPWGDVGADIVIESSGRFTKREDAAKHLRDSVKFVVISAPAKGEDITICLGVNEDKFDVSKHKVISNASCTTNCLAPVAKVINDTFGIRHGIMTTIHSYTNDQRILDLPHKDLRRARAAGLSMIPTSTGAAKAVGLVLPELNGKLDGISVRVPTPNVSLVDLTFTSEKEASVESINDALRSAADGPMKGILGYSEGDLVSIDFKGNPHSSVVDLEYTRSIEPHMHKVLSWYDNEWGYSKRVLDLCGFIAKSG